MLQHFQFQENESETLLENSKMEKKRCIQHLSFPNFTYTYTYNTYINYYAYAYVENDRKRVKVK